MHPIRTAMVAPEDRGGVRRLVDVAAALERRDAVHEPREGDAVLALLVEGLEGFCAHRI